MKKSNLFGLLFTLVGAILLGYGILSAATTDDTSSKKSSNAVTDTDSKSYDCPFSKLMGGDDGEGCSKKMKAHCDEKSEKARDGKCDDYTKKTCGTKGDGAEKSEKVEAEGIELE